MQSGCLLHLFTYWNFVITFLLILLFPTEYFQNMLCSGWMESALSMKSGSTVRIPIPGDVLDVVLDFLYTDDVAKLNGI